jgi:AbrB family looped-hinge helix DNA binding protein
MLDSSVTSKGQVTVPAALRRKLGLSPGDRVAFVEEEGRVFLKRVDTRVESAFGLVKVSASVTLEGMEAAISAARGRRARR